jgi:integrase
MPKIARELSAMAVSRLREPGMHAVGGAPGLHLVVGATGSRSWIARISVNSKRRDVGLGSFPAVGLAEARESARELRRKASAGEDPIAARRAEAAARATEAAAAVTFDEASKTYIESQASEWSHPRQVQIWTNSLATYASPIIGKLAVGDIRTAHIVEVLKPIWTTKTETATRVRERIERVISAADALAERDRLNPARWVGALDKIFPKPSKVAPVKHHEAVPWRQVPKFMVDLRLRPGIAAWALEFAILTAARSGEVRGMIWDEVDLDQRLWTVPGERMKMRREHRVPLSSAALELLQALPRGEERYVFPSPFKGVKLSDMTLAAVMRRMKLTAVPHGFRSSFRDWAAEATNHPHAAAELALAHAVGNAVEAAYRRGDMLDKRRELMEDWGRYCESGTVTPESRPPDQSKP